MRVGQRLRPERRHRGDEVLQAQRVAGVAGVLALPHRQDFLQAVQGEGQPHRAARFVQQRRQDRQGHAAKPLVAEAGRQQLLVGDMRLFGGGQGQDHPAGELPGLAAGVGASLAGGGQGPFQLPQIMGVQPGPRRQVGDAGKFQPPVAQQFGQMGDVQKPAGRLVQHLGEGGGIPVEQRLNHGLDQAGRVLGGTYSHALSQRGPFLLGEAGQPGRLEPVQIVATAHGGSTLHHPGQGLVQVLFQAAFQLPVEIGAQQPAIGVAAGVVQRQFVPGKIRAPGKPVGQRAADMGRTLGQRARSQQQETAVRQGVRAGDEIGDAGFLRGIGRQFIQPVQNQHQPRDPVRFQAQRLVQQPGESGGRVGGPHVQFRQAQAPRFPAKGLMQHRFEDEIAQLLGPGLELAPDVKHRHGGIRPQRRVAHFGGTRQAMGEHALAGVARRGQPEHPPVAGRDEAPQRFAQIVRPQVAGFQQLGFQQCVDRPLAVVVVEQAGTGRRPLPPVQITGLGRQLPGAVHRHAQAVAGQIIQQDEAIQQVAPAARVVQKHVLLGAHRATAQCHQRRQAQGPPGPFQHQRRFRLAVGAGLAVVPVADRPPAGEGWRSRLAPQQDAGPQPPLDLVGQMPVDAAQLAFQIRQIIQGVQMKRAMAEGFVAPVHQVLQRFQPRCGGPLAGGVRGDERRAEFGQQQPVRQPQDVRGELLADDIVHPVTHGQRTAEQRAPRRPRRIRIAVRDQIAGHHQRRELHQHFGQILELKDRRHDLALVQQLPQALVFVGDGAGPPVGDRRDPGNRRLLPERPAAGDGGLGQGRGVVRRLPVGQGGRGVALAQGLHRQHHRAALVLRHPQIGQLLAGEVQQLLAPPAGGEERIRPLRQLQMRQPGAQVGVRIQIRHVEEPSLLFVKGANGMTKAVPFIAASHRSAIGIKRVVSKSLQRRAERNFNSRIAAGDRHLIVSSPDILNDWG